LRIAGDTGSGGGMYVGVAIGGGAVAQPASNDNERIVAVNSVLPFSIIRSPKKYNHFRTENPAPT
jgi:hypothetical protein